VRGPFEKPIDGHTTAKTFLLNWHGGNMCNVACSLSFDLSLSLLEDGWNGIDITPAASFLKI
jgi:hypothetical protein